MKLEILRTYVDLKAINHNIKPEFMSIGGFSIELNGKEISYDNFEFNGGWDNKKDYPYITWECRGGSEVYSYNNIELHEEDYLIEDINTLPEITALYEVYYEAFNEVYNDGEYVENIPYPFEVADFVIVIIDRETNETYEISASNKVIKDYNVMTEKELKACE